MELFFFLFERKERGKWTIPKHSRSSECCGIIQQSDTVHAEHQGCFFIRKQHITKAHSFFFKCCMLPGHWGRLFCLCSVTSSEKVDKAQRYADFTLLSVPYPGKTLSSDLLHHSTSSWLERFLNTMVRFSEGAKPGVWQYLLLSFAPAWMASHSWQPTLCPSSSSPTCMHVF